MSFNEIIFMLVSAKDVFSFLFLFILIIQDLLNQMKFPACVGIIKNLNLFKQRNAIENPAWCFLVLTVLIKQVKWLVTATEFLIGLVCYR